MKDGEKFKRFKLHEDEEGRCVVHMTVRDDSNFLSPFSSDGTPTISDETAEFLNHNTKPVYNDKRLSLVITSAVIDDEEQKTYKKAIENYYRIECGEISKEIKRNNIVSAIMTAFSALIFAIAITLGTATNTSDVILNMLDVFAWVFLWEAVDIFFLQRPQLKRKRRKCMRIADADITFIDLNK